MNTGPYCSLSTTFSRKDFKVKSMVDWKGDHDYAVLACPYFQYPKNSSQIYGQALDNNVCLLSWEHLLLLLENNIVETKQLNLAHIWNISDTISENVKIKDKNKNLNFHVTENKIICQIIGVEPSDMEGLLNECRSSIIGRGESEIEFWKNKIIEIEKYSREQAILELVSALKLKEKIYAIDKYINSLRTKNEADK